MAPAGFVASLVMALTSSFSGVYDYLQDFCVAVPDATAAGSPFPNYIFCNIYYLVFIIGFSILCPKGTR